MIPISTDAPIYHYPIATVGMIVLNVIMFFAFCLTPGDEKIQFVDEDGRIYHNIREAEDELTRRMRIDPEEGERFKENLEIEIVDGGWRRSLSLEFNTIKPWQWVTNNFMHGGIGHLIGNMIFLWAFGIIVEGKVGSLLFTLIYVGIGTLYGFTLQFLSLIFWSHGSALGASAAIFGLLAFCIAWAPANEFTIWFRFFTFDITILMYGFFFVAQEVFFFGIQGFSMSSELLHILGFAVSLPIGLWMVRNGHVDCEGWDLISYLQGNTGTDSIVGKDKIKQKAQKQRAKEREAIRQLNTEPPPEQRVAKMVEQVEQAINQGEYGLAVKLQNRINASNPSARWQQQHLFRIIQGLLQTKTFDQVVPLIETHIEQFDENRFAMQVTLIKIWLQQQRPRKSIEYMRQFNVALLEPAQTETLKKLAAVAKKQISDGVVELQ